MTKRFLLALIASAASLQAAIADPIVATDALAEVEASATFDSTPTSTYVEDGLTFINTSGGSTGIARGFDAFNLGVASTQLWYFGGTTGYLEVQAESGSVFEAVQFLLGDGYTGFGCCRSTSTTTLVWEALLGGSIVSSGFETIALGSVRFTLSSGTFDTLRLGARPGNTALGQSQAIAIDDFTADYVGSPSQQQVPEPGTLALLGLGIVAVGLRRRRT